MTLGQLRLALREHRLEEGLTFAELAEAIGGSRVSLMTLKRFIEGETKPHELTEYAIRQYLERIAQKRSA